MKSIVIFFIFLVCSASLAYSEVTPVVYDQPLALRAVPSSASSLQPVSTRGLDDWLNMRINSDTTGQVQNEQQVVVNPVNPDNVVAVWRDFRLGYRRVGVGWSFDGGYTWEDDLFVEPTFPRQSDPGLTWHTSGTIYAVVLSFDWGDGDGLFVSSSTNGGITWGPWVPAVVNNSYELFEDKELMACDRSGSQYDGNLYIAWARFEYTPSQQTTITLVRSTDGGSSWDPSVAVSDESGVQWPVPVVGPDGEVYIGWVKYYDDEIRFDRSFDGGMTWGDDVTVQSTSFANTSIDPELSIFAFPAMDVDITDGPNRGTIYIAYTDDWYGDTDIFLTKSTNGGIDWTTPIRINDDPIGNVADQFHPWLVCDENGYLHLTFYDRRNDVPRNILMDLYYSYSSDAGSTWSPNERITDVSSNPARDSLDSGLIGEYNGLAVRNGVIHPVWTDTRNGHQDTYTAVWEAPVPVRPPEAGTIIGWIVDVSPNPFNDELRINFSLNRQGSVELTVFDTRGRKVETVLLSDLPPGEYVRIWKPNGPSGIYFLRASGPDGIQVKKIFYLK